MSQRIGEKCCEKRKAKEWGEKEVRENKLQREREREQVTERERERKRTRKV